MLSRRGIQVMSTKLYDRLYSEHEGLEWREALVRSLSPEAAKILDLAAHSPSQLKQDVFALVTSGFKRGGYFVEFGATDGVEFSNTLMLERDYGWTGILAEPSRSWQPKLRRNRPSATIETDCVWSTTGKPLSFSESTDAGTLSTITDFVEGDINAHGRTGLMTYDVPTVSLLDMLRRHKAPRQIDFLSIDTEGSEYEILSAFDFDAFDIHTITVEHNYTAAREKLFALLTGHGYRRKFEDVSKFDDWYVREH